MVLLLLLSLSALGIFRLAALAAAAAAAAWAEYDDDDDDDDDDCCCVDNTAVAVDMAFHWALKMDQDAAATASRKQPWIDVLVVGSFHEPFL